jgi:hypothetical protein
LADADKEHRLREQAVAEQLQTMSAAAGGTYFAFSPSLTVVAFLHLLILSFPAFPVPFVIQDLLGYLCRLCNPTMIH